MLPQRHGRIADNNCDVVVLVATVKEMLPAKGAKRIQVTA